MSSPKTADPQPSAKQTPLEKFPVRRVRIPTTGSNNKEVTKERLLNNVVHLVLMDGAVIRAV